MTKKTYFHAIKLIQENCTGCTKCVRVCPTEALRVRNGKVRLDADRCIDCGDCIRACPFKAIVPVADSLPSIEKFKYKLAVLASTYAGQFPLSTGYAAAKKAVLRLGFDDVAEEAMITGQMSSFIRNHINSEKNIRPVISSNCPSVVRLIQVRFPDLLPNILPIEAPMSVLSAYYRDKICRETGLQKNEIGIFLIVPCISQVTAVHQPEGSYKNLHDGALAISEVYSHVINNVRNSQSSSSKVETYPNGLNWAISGLQAEKINDGKLKTLAVSGINNVIEILAKIENQQLDRYDFIVLNSCTNGCVGGVLNVENSFIAASRIRDLVRNSKPQKFHNEIFEKMYRQGEFSILSLEPRSIMTLDNDIKTALEIMKKIEDYEKNLPGLDCSACGSPTCRALAEDIVAGKASKKDCVVLLRSSKDGEPPFKQREEK